MAARTNIVLNEELVEEVKSLTSLKTKKEVVDLALNELLKQLKRKKLLAMRHKGARDRVELSRYLPLL